jgi:hypothetical protein
VSTNGNNQIYTLIPKVMEDIGAISKNRKNEQQKYSFRGIEDFYQAAHPAMIKHSIFCAPTVVERDVYRFEKTNDQGRVTTWVHVALKVEHRFYAPDGSFVPVTTWGEGLDNSDKASNKAMSGAMKYALIELFCVPTQDVEDSDRTSPENGMRRPPVETVKTPRTFKLESAPLNNEKVGEPQKGIHPPDGADKPFTPELPIEETFEPPVGTPVAEKVDYITAGQASNLHKEFRETVKKYAPDQYLKADEHLYQFLTDKGCLDDKGQPTAGRITAKNWFPIKEAALKYARSL